MIKNIGKILAFQAKVLKYSGIKQLLIAFSISVLEVFQLLLLSIVLSDKRYINIYGNYIDFYESLSKKELYIIFICLLVFKQILTYVIVKNIHKLNFEFQEKFCNGLIESLFRSPMQNIKKVDVKKFSKVCQKDVEDLCYQVFNQIPQIYTELITCFALACLLLITNLHGGIVLIILLITYGLVSFILKKNYFIKVLDEKNKYEVKRFEVISESISNAIYAKYFQSENYFLKKLHFANKVIKKISVKEYLNRDFEKNIFELMIIILIIGISVFSESSYSTTFFLVAILKVGLSISKLINYHNQIKQNLIKFKNVSKDYKPQCISEIKKTNINADSSIAKITYIGRLNLNLNGPGIYLLKGKSGIGKTTILHEIIGFINTDAEIKVNDLIGNLSGLVIGYCDQEKRILADTIKNNIVYGKPYNDRKFKSSLEFSALDETDCDRVLRHGASEISGGEAQRICLSRAFYQNQSNIFILDEPLTGLDGVTAIKVFKQISNLSKDYIFLIVNHDSTFDQASKVIYNLT